MATMAPSLRDIRRELGISVPEDIPIINPGARWMPRGLFGELEYGFRKGSQAFETPAQAATRVAQEDKALALQRQREMDMRRQMEMDRQYELEQAKIAETRRYHDILGQISSGKMKGSLAQHGLEMDEQGNVVPIPVERLTPEQQADVQAKQSLSELRQAQKERQAAMQDMDWLKYQQADRRLQIAEGNLGLRGMAESRRSEQFEFQKGGKSAQLYEPALDADKRLRIMMENARDTSGQGDVSLLFNHIGMTLSAQKGARITEAEIKRAIETRSLPGELLALWQSVSTGKFLTPTQRREMVKLAVEMREEMWEKARRLGGVFPEGTITEPSQHSGMPPVKGTPGAQAPAKPGQVVEEYDYDPATRTFKKRGAKK